MKTRIIRIGNSQGLRIPKLMLEQTGLALDGEVEIKVRSDSLLVSRTAKPRAGWAAAFQEMARNGDDALPIDDVLSTTTWEDEGWLW